MNKRIEHNRSLWGFLLLSLLLVSLLQISACVHKPVIIMPGPSDTNPRDTMPIDTMPVDSLPVDTLIPKPCDPDTVYFRQELLPILSSNCASSGCHDADSHESDVILDSYENTIKTTEIKISDPTDSDIYKVITELDPGNRMPPPPASALNSEDAALILKWIQQGAQDLSCEAFANCDTMSRSYQDQIKPILDLHCVACHRDGNAGGGVKMDTYARVQNLADNGQLVGAITHADGYEPMPKNEPKLATCEILQISAWVNQGALEN